MSEKVIKTIRVSIGPMAHAMTRYLAAEFNDGYAINTIQSSGWVELQTAREPIEAAARAFCAGWIRNGR